MRHDPREPERPAQTALAQTGPAQAAPVRRPVYAKVLRLRHIHPSGMLCFLFFEGAVALAVVLALAELVSWWAVVALPVAVAAMVKLNDLVAGAAAGHHKHPAPPDGS